MCSMNCNLIWLDLNKMVLTAVDKNIISSDFIRCLHVPLREQKTINI